MPAPPSWLPPGLARAHRLTHAALVLTVVATVGAWLLFAVDPGLPAELLGLVPADAGGRSALRSDIGGLLLAIGMLTLAGIVGSSRWLGPAAVVVGCVLLSRLIGLAVDGPSVVGIAATVAELGALGALLAGLFAFPHGLGVHPYHPAYQPLEWVWVPIHRPGLLRLFNRLVRLGTRLVPLPPGLERQARTVRAPDQHAIPVVQLRPAGATGPLPAIVWFHGGGFALPEAPHHRRLAHRMAQDCGCVVLTVDYRLSLDHPHPTGLHDCLAVLRDVFDSAEALGIDPRRVAVGGDSAGGALALASCLHLRDEGGPQPCHQLLVYPFADETGRTDSARRFTDTPVWNSRKTPYARALHLRQIVGTPPWDAVPGRAAHFRDLPPAWVETAVFDPLRDEGREVARRMAADGVAVVHHEQPGTVHGFELVPWAPPTQAALRARHAALRAAFDPAGAAEE